jgi:hypothetical protein
MVNPGEVPLKVVMFVEPKLLYGLGPKGMWPGVGAQRSPAADDAPPAERHDLTRSVTSTERGKPVVLPWQHGREVARQPVGTAGRGSRSKRRPTCNGADRGCKITSRESGQTSSGCGRS